ncbi:MAG: type VI secretion system lipoprotein TssJ [Methylococcales bacterium]|nr:type VI secretion system lipoprotein TssJ [Methylococcaceae bacterium]
MIKHSSLLLMCSVLLQSCASDPLPPEPPPPPTVVNLQIEAGDDINPDIDGRGSPVMLRIYELKEVSVFNSADFFALFDKEQATLSSDLARKQEFLLKPGETKALTLEPDTDVKNIGFFAAFRQLDTAQWRALAPVKPHQTLGYKLKIKASQLSVEPIEQPVAPPPAKE